MCRALARRGVRERRTACSESPGSTSIVLFLVGETRLESDEMAVVRCRVDVVCTPERASHDDECGFPDGARERGDAICFDGSEQSAHVSRCCDEGRRHVAVSE